MEHKNTPEESSNTNEGCFRKLPKSVRVFMAACVLRPQTYWMTSEMKKEALKELGFKRGEDGEIYETQGDKPVSTADLDQALKDGEKLLDQK